MSWKRSLLAMVAIIAYVVLVSRALDHEWPADSWAGWAIYLGGFVVIWIGGTIVERWIGRRRAAARAATLTAPAPEDADTSTT